MIKHQCINDEGTLFETISPDVWQRRVLAADGSELGVAVAEVIEPRQCAVRYLILLDVRNHRRLLLPATYVVDAEDGSIISNRICQILFVSNRCHDDTSLCWLMISGLIRHSPVGS